ncbi:YbhB/YbcL family Raf kinase inhibitor-like protein [Rhizobium laguerreae]|uniref:YbhB/YbcL family Raf kinase inhibitor-like protein n=1 Tax=Rhizobium laguerreae TaxID=1076926 RepID=UPI001C902BCE|nr:YbhB/YbcL family Raf kinase inhibitor-like protein [Rhizobium laguerreae]MBY3383234.1 YbhB/YbcL family Raf kinase inhibitor-like protein [Rhizobium laguerreae]
MTSPDIENGGKFSNDQIKDGGNLPPQLGWTDPPDGTQSFALMIEDLDAPSAPAFRHWEVFDIPKDRRHLARGRSSSANTESLPHAVNDFGINSTMGRAHQKAILRTATASGSPLSTHRHLASAIHPMSASGRRRGATSWLKRSWSQPTQRKHRAWPQPRMRRLGGRSERRRKCLTVVACAIVHVQIRRRGVREIRAVSGQSSLLV